MRSIVEIVARAMQACPAFSSFWSDEDYQELANAAIAAVLASMREPSEGMLDAGYRQASTPGKWKAMLAAWEKENGL